MEFNVLKAGDKVKFNGKTFKEASHSGLTSNMTDYRWLDSMTDFVKANHYETFVVSSVYTNGCVELMLNKKVIAYSWTPLCLELVNPPVEPKLVPHKQGVQLTPHPHADVIKAYADGHTIQCKQGTSGKWYDITLPNFSTHCEYRVKPVEPVVTYKYQGVTEQGWINPDVYNTKTNVALYHNYSKGKLTNYVEKTFHDDVLVNIEIISA